MPLTDFGAQKTLNGMLGLNHATTWPGTVYIGLSTTNPATSVTEPTGVGSYNRASLVNNATNFPDIATGRSKPCPSTITFPVATANWGTITHWVMYDNLTGGNLLGYGSLTASQAVNNGDLASIPGNALVVSIT